ncbi:hypothetical protein V8C40DRAFT_230849 [Trichoderma camerunense]
MEVFLIVCLLGFCFFYPLNFLFACCLFARQCISPTHDFRICSILHLDTEKGLALRSCRDAVIIKQNLVRVP